MFTIGQVVSGRSYSLVSNLMEATVPDHPVGLKYPIPLGHESGVISRLSNQLRAPRLGGVSVVAGLGFAGQDPVALLAGIDEVEVLSGSTLDFGIGLQLAQLPFQ